MEKAGSNARYPPRKLPYSILILALLIAFSFLALGVVSLPSGTSSANSHKVQDLSPWFTTPSTDEIAYQIGKTREILSGGYLCATPHCVQDDMEFVTKNFDKCCIDRLRMVAITTFERVTYTEAVELLKKSGAKFENEVEWGIDLASEHERFLTGIIRKECYCLQLS